MINIACYDDLLNHFENRKNQFLNNAYKGFYMSGSCGHYNDLPIFTMNIEYSIGILKKDRNILEKEIINGTINSTEGYIITENYYIDMMTSFSVIKFSDVVMIYKGLFAQNFACVTKDGVLLRLRNIFIKNDKKWFEASDFVLSKCKDVLVGKGKKNRKILKDKYNIDLKDMGKWNILI